MPGAAPPAETAVQREVRAFLDEVQSAGRLERMALRRRLRAFVKGKANYTKEDRDAYRDGLLDVAAEFESIGARDSVDATDMQWVAGLGSGAALAGIGLLAAALPAAAVAVPIVGGLGVAGVGLVGRNWLKNRSNENLHIAADLREFAEGLKLQRWLAISPL